MGKVLLVVTGAFALGGAVMELFAPWLGGGAEPAALACAGLGLLAASHLLSARSGSPTRTASLGREVEANP